MKCEECELVMEEYFDGELDGPIREAIRLHVGRCLACTAVLHELSAEQEAYESYQPGLEISPKLWANVCARIGIEDLRHELIAAPGWQVRLSQILAGPRVSAWLTAGLVLMAVGLTVLVMNLVREENGPILTGSRNVPATIAMPERPALTAEARTQPQTPNDTLVKPKNNGTGANLTISATANRRKTTTVVEQSRRVGTPDQLVYEAEQKYLAAIAMLSRSVGRKRAKLDPATLTQFDQVLTAIDRTIAGTRKAVRQHPDDPMAVQYMLTAYARKVDVLREMVGY